MKGTFNTTTSAANNTLNFGLAAAIRSLKGVQVAFKVVNNFERLTKDGGKTGKVYNAIVPCLRNADGTCGNPLIEGFALTKWDLNPQPRLSKDKDGKIVRFDVTVNRLYAVAAAKATVGITEVDWLTAIANELNGSIVEPLDYEAINKDGGSYPNTIFGVK